MPVFLIILNSIATVVVIGSAIAGSFFYLSRQVSRITQQSEEIMAIKQQHASEIAALKRQLEEELQRIDKTNQRIGRTNQNLNVVADYVNGLRMGSEQTMINLGQKFVPITFDNDE